MFALERIPIDYVVVQLSKEELQYLFAACRELFEQQHRRDTGLGEIMDNIQDIAKERDWVL